MSPWDQETVLDSVKKTGRLIVIDESNPQCNIAGDVASVIGDVGFDYLDGQLRSDCTRHSCTICSEFRGGIYAEC